MSAKPHTGLRTTRSLLLAAQICAVLLPGTAPAALIDIRSYDGSGNNLSNPDWGQAGTQLLRLQPAAYPGDGSGDAIVTEPDRPNPRDISNRVARQDSAVTANSYGMSNMLWQWGQFIDHDITLVHSGAGFGTAPIAINDPADPFYPGPMPFNRSAFDPATGTAGTPREQLNAITAYLDASMVYGSSQTMADSLRTFSGGQLRTSAGNLLPTETVPGPGGAMTVFVAGDERANEQVGLTAMHTVFMREHNRLAGALAAANPGLSDEQIYQTARRIVGAEVQKITYEEFLPTLLGPHAPLIAPSDYDASINATIANSFATALFRFGHTMLPSEFQLRNGSGSVVDTLALRDAFFNPDFLRSDPANLERVLRGLAAQPAQQIDNMLVDDVRNFLFGIPGMGGLDLASLNIQRGRDHGLASYNAIRAAHGLTPVSSFDAITTDPLLAQALRDLYGTTGSGDDNLDALDLWVAGLAETHLTGAAVGELVAAALVDQFSRLAIGDRFFYLWDVNLFGDPDVAAVIDLDSVSLGQVLAWNTSMGSAQANMFLVSAVSLPGVAWLLLAGLLALAGGRRRTPRMPAFRSRARDECPRRCSAPASC